MIHALLDTTQVIAAHEIDGITYEVCAEIVATHDRKLHMLTANLRCFLRALDQEQIHQETTAPWLPEPEVALESVEAHEAHAMADDIFASWIRRVLACMPEEI
jgi:hypothetical protein